MDDRKLDLACPEGYAMCDFSCFLFFPLSCFSPLSLFLSLFLSPTLSLFGVVLGAVIKPPSFLDFLLCSCQCDTSIGRFLFLSFCRHVRCPLWFLIRF